MVELWQAIKGAFRSPPNPFGHTWFHFHGWAVANYQGGFPIAPEPLRAYLVSFSWLSCGKLSRGLSGRPRTPSGILGFIFMVELWQAIKGAFRSPPNPFGHTWFHFHGWAVANYQGGFPIAPEPLRAYLVSFSWLSCGKLSRGLSGRPRTPSGILGFIFMVELWQTIKGAFRSPP